MCLWAIKQGWRVVYDPSIVVDHFPGQRPAGDLRSHAPFQVTEDDSYNLVTALLTLEPRLFWRRAAYGLAVGDRRNPGLVRAIAALFAADRETIRKLLPSFSGQTKGLLDIARRRPVAMTPVEASGWWPDAAIPW